EGVQAYLRGGAQLFATGTGLLGLLMMAPGGLGEVVYGLRDRALRALARAKGLSVPSLAETAAFAASGNGAEPGARGAPGDSGDGPMVAEDGAALGPKTPAPGGRPEAGLLTCTGIDAAYGQVQVLF